MNYNYSQNQQLMGAQFQGQGQNQQPYIPQNQSQTLIPMQTQMPVAPMPFFMQSQGAVFNINSSNEAQNIPAQVGLVNVGVCLRENTLYLKSIQNGAPVLMTYRISPIDENSQQDETNKKIATILEDYDVRLKKIEQSLISKNETKGGPAQWQL